MSYCWRKTYYSLTGPFNPSDCGWVEEPLRCLTRHHLQELGQNQETSKRQSWRHVLTLSVSFASVSFCPHESMPTDDKWTFSSAGKMNDSPRPAGISWEWIDNVGYDIWLSTPEKRSIPEIWRSSFPEFTRGVPVHWLWGLSGMPNFFLSLLTSCSFHALNEIYRNFFF